MDKRVNLCVLFYNNKNIASTCLAHLEKEVIPNVDVDVIALDNGSTDGTYDIIKQFKGIRALRIEENRFFSGGANYLLDQCESEHVFFMSSDIYPERNVIPEIIKFVEERNDIGILGCRSILPDGSTEKTAKRFLNPWLLHLKYGAGSVFFKLFDKRFSKWYLYQEDGFPFDDYKEVDIVQDSFIYINGELVDKGLRYDENMRLYFTEDDICMRTRKLGHRVVFFKDVQVFHDAHSTVDFSDKAVWRMYLRDCVDFTKEYHGTHGSFLESAIRFKERIKSAVDRPK